MNFYTKGFSLIETLVAISVLSISITAASSIVRTSLASSQYTRAHAVAVGLATEGVELVRGLHNEVEYSYYNSDMVMQSSFYNVVEACTHGCALDINTLQDTPVVCDGVNSCSLYYHEQEGFVDARRGSGDKTSFTRDISIKKKNFQGQDGVEFDVISEVEFEVRGELYTVDMSTTLYLPLEVIVPEP